MKFGVFAVLTDETITPAELGAAAESFGFESVFVPEHTHIPVQQETEFPFGGEVPRGHRRTLDPIVALSAAAAATQTLRLATGICLVLQHHPISLAKAIASLDRVSGGRVLFGVGAGWNREEMRNHGVVPSTRMAALKEHVEAIKHIWAADEPEYHGRFVDFDPIWSWPKPEQQPHPPLLVGGNHENALDRVLDLGAGWLPNVGRFDDDALGARMTTLRQRAADRGCEPPSVTAFRAKPRAAALARYEELGVERCVFALPDGPRDQSLERLERWAEIVKSHTGVPPPADRSS